MHPHLLLSVALWEGELHPSPGLSFSRRKGKTRSALPCHWPPCKQSVSVVGDINIFLGSAWLLPRINRCGSRKWRLSPLKPLPAPGMTVGCLLVAEAQSPQRRCSRASFSIACSGSGLFGEVTVILNAWYPVAYERRGGLVRSWLERRAGKKSGCGCPLNLVVHLLSESTAALPKINSPSSVLPGKHMCSDTQEVVALRKGHGNTKCFGTKALLHF